MIHEVYDVYLSRRLPRPVEVPCDYGQLTRMLATRVRVSASNRWSQSPIYVSVRGPGLRKDGSRSKMCAFAYVDGAGAPERRVTREMLGDDNWRVISEARAAAEAAVQVLVAEMGGDES